jgi:hypothetical protein
VVAGERIVEALRQAQLRVATAFFVAVLKPPSSSRSAVAVRESWKRASILLVFRDGGVVEC